MGGYARLRLVGVRYYTGCADAERLVRARNASSRRSSARRSSAAHGTPRKQPTVRQLQ